MSSSSKTPPPPPVSKLPKKRHGKIVNFREFSEAKFGEVEGYFDLSLTIENGDKYRICLDRETAIRLKNALEIYLDLNHD